MSRNFNSIPSSYNARFDQWAQSRCIETEVAAAIHEVAGGNRTPELVWEQPTDAEHDNVMMCLNEWAANGDIEADVYQWGTPFTVTAA